MEKTGVLILSLILCISLLSFTLASELEFDAKMIQVVDKAELREEIKEQVKAQYEGIREEIIDEAERKLRERIQLESLGGIREKEFYFERNGKKIKLRIEESLIGGEIERKLKARLENGEEIEIKTKLRIRNLSEEDIEKKRLRVELSNGEEKEIKILPDEASNRARKNFGTRNLRIELKEKMYNNFPRVIYHIQAEKVGKFLGILKTKIQITGEIDSVTGELLEKRKVWWAFLVAGEDNPEEGLEE